MTPGRAIPLGVLALAGAPSASVLSPGAAPAQSPLARFEPGRSAAVTRPPERIWLWFGEGIEPADADLPDWTEAGKPVHARIGSHVVQSSFAVTVRAGLR